MTSKANEGYICPECFLNLDSEAALLAHFEKKHGDDQSMRNSHYFLLSFLDNDNINDHYKDSFESKTGSSPKHTKMVLAA